MKRAKAATSQEGKEKITAQQSAGMGDGNTTRARLITEETRSAEADSFILGYSGGYGGGEELHQDKSSWDRSKYFNPLPFSSSLYSDIPLT